ncbi:hypothetical protein H7100_02990 [Candidatus Saccharibacteria bacterium]|nr:hypothetical protein [Candidatus Saccharibacteria bacterium]
MSKLYSRSVGVPLLVIASAALIVLGLFSAHSSPSSAFGGAVWFDHGPHYLAQEAITNRVKQIQAPLEAKMLEDISVATPSCDDVESGFCESITNNFTEKVLAKSAVSYKAAIPDRQEVASYCTVCRDGTFSPSCAVGRGACSHHSGVASYNVPQYRTIYGSSEIAAEPAVFTYTSKSYKDSSLYTKPTDPSLKTIVEFAN